MKKQVSFYVDENIVKNFQVKYPRVLTLFLSRALSVCLDDKELFQRIFFGGK